MKALAKIWDNSEETRAELDLLSSRAAIRECAQQALKGGDYPLVESLLGRGEVSVAELTDNLLIYQAELEIQNEELRRAQVDEQRAIARFTTLFARIPLAVLVVDRTGLILQANEAADHLFGLQAHHLSQRFLYRLLESPRNALGQVLVDVRTTGVSLARSVAFRTAGGGRFVGDLHMTRLPAMEGDDRQFVCAVVDLTEQLKRQTELQAAEERLRRSEARNRILADFSPDWEYWIGTDGQYV